MNISSIVFCLFTIQVVINAFSRDFSYGMKFRLGRSAIEASSPTFTDSTFSLERIHNAGFPSAFIAGINKEIYDRPERRRPQYDAPIIVLPGFVTAAECSEIIRVGSELESKGIVADLYLNHRVNKDLSSGNVSSEAQQLIQEQNLSEEELAADSPSGFRSPLPPSVLLSGEPLLPSSPRGHAIFPPSNSIGQRILQLVGCEDRKISFLEDLWINPNKDCIRIRDQTTVHYRPGEGVPPHVDGNHVTILIYLNDMEVRYDDTQHLVKSSH